MAGAPGADLSSPARAHEGRGLGPVVGVLLGQQRDHDEEPDVDEERPEDPVADGVEPLQAEECGRPEEADTRTARPSGSEGASTPSLPRAGRISV